MPQTTPKPPTVEELEQRIDRALAYLHPHLDTGDSRTAPDWAVALAGILCGATVAQAEDTPRAATARQLRGETVVVSLTNDEPLPRVN